MEVPALTTVRQPLDELGKLAVRALWDLMQGKEVSHVIYTESELHIRNSCGCTAPWENREKETLPDYSGGMINKSEYHLQNVSLLGQALVTINSLGEMFTPLRFFLTNLAVKTFYLVLYPKPLEYIGKTGNLVYLKTENGEMCQAGNREILEMKDFFSDVIMANKPGAWCVYYLRSGREFLGMIVYEASDRVHPQMCSAAAFLANTIKRLQIYEDEKEQSLKLEQEVAIRTKDLGKEIHRRMEVEAEVLRISEMERLRFSMDLHDDICQRLAGISMFCKSLIHTVSPQTFLPELSELIDETLARTRRYAHDSFPVELDTMGLKEAMGGLCHTITKQSSCRCNFSWIGPEKSPFGSAQDLNIYRIAQEALQNAVKHAGADLIDVGILFEKKIFSVIIRDNGTGGLFANEENSDSADVKRYIKRGGLGLRSMRYRAHQLGAEYIFESSEQDGTRVEIRIPLL
jgi:signal transduction histidine kinase